MPSRARNSQSRIQAIRSIPGLQLLLPIFEDLLPLPVQNAAKWGRGGICNTEKPRCLYNRESGFNRSKRCFGPGAKTRIRKGILTAGEKISLLPRNYFWVPFMTIKDISPQLFLAPICLWFQESKAARCPILRELNFAL